MQLLIVAWHRIRLCIWLLCQVQTYHHQLIRVALKSTGRQILCGDNLLTLP